MMNNQYNTTNIPTQHSIQMAHHVASPPHAPTAVINTFLNAQQQQQQNQHLAATGALYGDHSQLQINSNPIEKNYYTTTSGSLGPIGPAQRFYTTGNTAHHPNTILITNNFSHQQAAQSINPEQQQNIRIVATSNPLSQTNNSNLATTTNGYQHAQHVYNLSNNKQLQHMFPQHLLSQSSFQQTATNELLPQNFANQPFSSSPQHQQPNPNMSTSTVQVPHYYMSPENTITAPINTNHKIMSIPSNSVTTADGNAVTESLVGNCSNANNSTVVLDRINICINNLYTDTSSSSASNSLASTPAQQPSPIIPAIQHKPIIENGPTLPIVDIYEANVLVIDEPDSTTTATTPQTPPTTPESPPTSTICVASNANNNNLISTTSSSTSPSTSYNYQKSEQINIEVKKLNFFTAAQNIEEAAQNITNYTEKSDRSLTLPTILNKSEKERIQTQTTTTTADAPLTPPTTSCLELDNKNKENLIDNKETTNVEAVTSLFENGEDVFIKRHDDRFYLGTVIDTARNQFLVRFDDKTEIWCEAKEMRKLGISSTGNNASSNGNSIGQPMCVSCKTICLESTVEICERCGRGYHRKCTTETLPGSNIWQCKRCAKPMKLDETLRFSSGEEETEVEACYKLHYNLESLTWDDKHRTNAEQIYCYCGKSGHFDQNMLQCWRCLNWYHSYCIQKFCGNILKGDSFFVFCCSVCNEGDEYLRRLQASWIDVVHLVLYNLATTRNHQKYYHIIKDIIPYLMEKRRFLPVPKEWILMPENNFLEKVKSVLVENQQIFMCANEIKRDINSFGLRSLEPPVVIKFSLNSQDIFDDNFIFNNLTIPLLKGAPENASYKFLHLNATNIKKPSKLKRKLNDANSHDVYEFEDTSDDEIPIKNMLDKAKKIKIMKTETATNMELNSLGCNNNNIACATVLEKMDVGDDNASDALITSLPEPIVTTLSATTNKTEQTSKNDEIMVSPVKPPSVMIANKLKEGEPSCHLSEKTRSSTIKPIEKSSRKRKAFTLSKSYNAAHLIDSSSDENSSSSSRGTSLDLIIPPPKNFLGQNNPFRIISPKKNIANLNGSMAAASNKKSVSFGIFNTTALNFSSKLAALKSAGLFPKLCTSNLVNAAGQPRTLRTIKRRLSAKDITIGPNKEVRRRRTRRLSSNIEVISTTTINPIPTNFFPIQAKDLLAAAAASTTTAASLFPTQPKITAPTAASININNTISNSITSTNIETVQSETSNVQPVIVSQPTHGRLLRQRPQKKSPNASRRSSVSSNQSSTSSNSVAGGAHALQTSHHHHQSPQQSHEDLKQTVNKYFGIVNRIESGEQFSIRAKRQLANGQMQYLIEWGEAQNVTTPIKSAQNISNQSIKTQLVDISTTII